MGRRDSHRPRDRTRKVITEAFLFKKGIECDPLCGLRYASRLFPKIRIKINDDSIKVFERLKIDRFEKFSHNIFGRDIKLALRMLQKMQRRRRR